MAVCQQYNTEPSLVYRSRRSTTNESRNIAIYLTRHLCGLPLGKIGAKFNIAKPSSVSSVVVRLAALLKHDTTLQDNICEIKKMINLSQERICPPPLSAVFQHTGNKIWPLCVV